jgi:hypothetical protein
MQDVTWIEQLGSKKQAIGAARTIAVASSAFSKDAIRAAEYYGIDLRVLSEISEAEMQSWVLPRFVVHVFKQGDLLEPPEIIFNAEQGDDFTSSAPMESVKDIAPTLESRVFIGSDGGELTLNDLWLKADDQLKIFEGVPKDDLVHLRRISLEPSDNLQICTRVGLRRVHSIKMSLSLRWRHERISLETASIFRYQPANPTDPMRPQIRAEFESREAAASNIRVGLQFQAGRDDISLTLQLTRGKP